MNRWTAVVENWQTTVMAAPAWTWGLGIAIGALVIVVLARLALSARAAPAAADLRAATSGAKRLGYGVILAFFVGFGGWATIAPIAGAALATGVVSPDGKRKTVQHLEGGIIETIHIREGDYVAAGQPLVTLQDTAARARYQELLERAIYLRAVEARLVAEADDARAIRFPDEPDAPSAARLERIRDGQRDRFESRRAAHLGRVATIGMRIEQFDAEIAGREEALAAQERQIALLGEEMEAVQALLDKGLARLPRLLGLQRLEADIHKEMANGRAAIARLRGQIHEYELELLNLRAAFREGVDEELGRVTAEIAALNNRLVSQRDVLRRTAVTAPISGTVVDLRVTTNTGVLVPGQPILDIVPEDVGLVVNARVRPNDIELVHSGMPAVVVLTAYSQRELPQIHGTVLSVSADRLGDERTGETYFLARVHVDEETLESVGSDVALLVGMQVDVMLITGERTLADYLLAPIRHSLDASFRGS